MCDEDSEVKYSAATVVLDKVEVEETGLPA